jgi:hypothetical protein
MDEIADHDIDGRWIATKAAQADKILDLHRC